VAKRLDPDDLRGRLAFRSFRCCGQLTVKTYALRQQVFVDCLRMTTWRGAGFGVSVFEVAIGPDSVAGKFRVEVLRSPDWGVASAVTELDVDALLARRGEIERAVRLSAIPARKVFPEEAIVREVGRILFGALLGAGEVGGRYRVATSLAAERGEELRVVLRIADSALAALPWETMWDSSAGVYVCRRDQLVRHVGVLAGVQSLPVEPPLRILGIVSSPRGLARLDVDKEKEQLIGVLSRLTSSGAAELAWAPSASWADLQDELRRGPWHVVHFIGHGDFDPHLDEGVLALTGEDGRAELVEASQIIDLLRTARPAPRLVVLNSCSGAAASTTDLFAGTAAALVQGGFSAVTAMQYGISDQAAIAFGRGFYGALAAGYGIDEAVSDGRRAIVGLSGQTLEWATPVLYLRGDASKLFTMAGQRQPAEAAPPATSPQPLAAAHPSGSAQPPAATTSRRRFPWLRSPAASPVQRVPSRLVRTINTLSDGVLGVSFSPRGTLIASAGANHTVRLWESASGDKRGSFLREGNHVRDVSFSPDGLLIASAWGDGAIRLFATSNPPAGDGMRSRDPEGDFPLSVGDADLLMHELARICHTPKEAEAVLRAVRFRANYEYILPAKYENFVDFPANREAVIYNCASWRNEFEFWNWVFERFSEGAIEAPYRRVIAAALRLQGENAVLGDLQRRYAVESAGLAIDRTRVLAGHAGLVLRAVFSGDGSLLASAGEDGKVLLWSMADKTIAGSIADPGVRALTFSPDGTQIVTAGDRHALRLWSVSSQTLSRSYVGHTGPVHAVAFSPHGYPLASAGLDGTVRLWDTAADGEVLRLTGEFSSARGVAFSPDGQLLAAATDENVTLWITSTGEHLNTLTGHSGLALDVAFSPAGKLLASAGQDGTIRVWE